MPGSLIFLFIFFTFLSTSHSSIKIQNFVQQAIQNSLDVESQKKVYENAQDSLTNASRFYFPQLSLQSNLGLREGSPPYNNQPEVSDLSLELSSLLFDNNRSRARWDQAAFIEQKEKLLLEKKRDEVALEAGSRYLQHYRLVKTRELARGILNLVEKQAGVIRSLYRQGLRTRKDYLRFEGQLLREQLRVAEIDLDLKRSESSLRELVPGLSEAYFAEFEKEFLPAQREDVLVPRLDEHRDLQVFSLNQKSREAQFISQKNQIWPDVRVTAKAEYFTSDFITRNPNSMRTEQRGVGGYLQLTWKMWDWGENQRKNAILSRDLEIQGIQDLRLERTLEKELKDLIERQAKARDFFAASSKLLEFESSNYNLLEADYRQGKSTALDLVTGVQSLSSAQTLKLSHEIELQRVHYEILYHQGRLYAHFLQ